MALAPAPPTWVLRGCITINWQKLGPTPRTGAAGPALNSRAHRVVRNTPRVRRRRSVFMLQRSAFQRAEPGWVILRHKAGRLWAEQGTSTPSS